MPEIDKQVDLVSLKNAALNLLARREHSRSELENKLILKFKQANTEADPDFRVLLQKMLDQLSNLGLQDDARFAEAYVRSRLRRGFGPDRISFELRHKGVSESLADLVLKDAYSAGSIYAVWRKKFSCYPQDLKGRVKQQQFLRYRGFTGEQIQQLFNDLCDHDERVAKT